jgi:hypothetical protein
MPVPPPPGTEMRNSHQPPRIFISYRRSDTRHLAGRLSDRLEERFPGAHVFMDVDTIEPGADFVLSIQDAVSRCDVLIAMIGPNWLTLEDENGHRRIDRADDYVALEIATALVRDIPVIPLLVDEVAMPRREELPDRLKPLSRRNAARLDHETFRTDIQRITTAVERAVRPPPHANTPATVTTPIPQIQHAAPSPRSPIPQPPVFPSQQPRPTRPRSSQSRSTSNEGIPPANLPLGQRKIPIYRVALRIGLWWTIVILGLIITIAGVAEIVSPTGNTTGAVLGGLFTRRDRNVVPRRLRLLWRRWQAVAGNRCA